MTSNKTRFSYKTALKNLPRGEPLGVDLLRKQGFSPSHTTWLSRHDWLDRLGRGAYALPGDTLTRDGCLAFLSTQIEGLHVGGRTALAWRGVRHQLAARERLHLWANQAARLPAWFTERFDAHLQTTQLFDTKLNPDFGLQPLAQGRKDVLVSVPERALLELLSDAGKVQSLEETRNLVENLRGLRNAVLQKLLAHTTRIKVVRLAYALATELDAPWAALAAEHTKRLGGGARWIGQTKTGERLILRRT